MIDWIKEAKEELKRYTSLLRAYKSNLDRLEAIQTSLYLSGIDYTKEPVDGGNIWAAEDNVITLLWEKDKIEQLNKINKSMISATERALNSLSKEYQEVLRYFYISNTDDYIERACNKLHYSLSLIHI